MAASTSILITSPVVTPQAIARLVALHARMGDLRVVADNPDNVDALAMRRAMAREPLKVLVDIDPGIRRTGVRVAGSGAARWRGRSPSDPSLRFAGVQYYCGAQQHIETFAERRAAIVERTDYLRGVVEAAARRGPRAGGDLRRRHRHARIDARARRAERAASRLVRVHGSPVQ